MAQSDLTRVVEPACRKLAEEQQVELVDVELAREAQAGICGSILTNPTELP